MDNLKQPHISTEAIILLESNFIRYPGNVDILEPIVQISYESSITEEGIGHGMLSVIASGTSKESGEKVFESRIRYLGVFVPDTEDPNLEIDEFLKIHAPAHIFPYVREFLTSLSTRAGMPPIILPPVNMVALIGMTLQGNVDIKSITPPVQSSPDNS